MTGNPNQMADSASDPTESSSLPPKKKLRRIRFFVYFVYFSILVFMLVFLVSNYQALNQLMHEGRVTSAEVTDKQSSGGKSESYQLTCEFEVDGQTKETWESVSRETYWHTRIGDKISITYLPADPKQSRMGKVDQAIVDDARLSGIVIFSFLAITFSLLTWYLESCVRR